MADPQDPTTPPAPPQGPPGGQIPLGGGDGGNKSHIPINIEDEMRRSYLDYAMSVIVGRELPAVRDGLKHVHRGILFVVQVRRLLSRDSAFIRRNRAEGLLPPNCLLDQ